MDKAQTARRGGAWRGFSGVLAEQFPDWLTSTRAGVGSSYTAEVTSPETEITAETAPEPSETGAEADLKSEDQMQYIGMMLAGQPLKGCVHGNTL